MVPVGIMGDGNRDSRGFGVLSEGRSSCLGDLETGLGSVCLSQGEPTDTHLRDGIFSRILKTSSIGGRDLESRFTQLIPSVASIKAPLRGYWPPNLVSISRNIFRLSSKWDFAQSTNFCSTPTFSLSTARRPLSSSSNTTPKLYTSHFAVNRPASRKNHSD